MSLRLFLIVFVFLGLPFPAIAAEKPHVVVSFSILADLVKNVGGDDVRITSLVPAGGDAHVYQAKPSDAKTLQSAQLVVINGLGFEGWMERLVRSSGYKGTFVVATKGIKALAAPHEEHHGHHHGHKHSNVDPHAWQDVENVITYVRNIRDGLIQIDPARKTSYDERAKAYVAQLEALHGSIKTQLSSVPRDQRKLITSHEAFRYYADAYDVDFYAAQGMNTEAQPSAKTVAKLIENIKAKKVKVLFFDTLSDQRLVQRIASETGASFGGTLYADALSVSPPAATYITMMQHNTQQLVSALQR